MNKETKKSVSSQAEKFKFYSSLFDEVIEKLPASGHLLSRIKQEYERAIVIIESRERVKAKREQKKVLKMCEVATINNYHKRIAELEFKATKLKLDNERIKDEMDQMNTEIQSLSTEKERLQHQRRLATPHMTSRKRRSLGLSLNEATSLSQLQAELVTVQQELEEVRIVAEKKYIPSERKTQLRKLLQEKEQVKSKVDETNALLNKQLKKLKFATQAVATYKSYLEQNQLDPHTLPLEQYIIAVIKANYDQMQDEEVDQDPAKEIEAEMILDCFEQFNELFGSEKYEEAALHAASSPKGVLRTVDTLNKFKHSARHTEGSKPPLLCYCEHLMACAPAYRPVSKEEGLECVQCALDNDGVALISHWIAQGVLYPSVEVGQLLMEHCKCLTRCTCGSMRAAFSVLDRCGEHKTAALCLVHQDMFMIFLSYAKKIGCTKEDYIQILCAKPSIGLVKALTESSENACLTVIEAANILLQNGKNEDAAALVKKEIQKCDDNCLQTSIIPDNSINEDAWYRLVDNLHFSGFSDLAMECLSALTVEKALQSAVSSLLQESSKSSQHVESVWGESRQTTPYGRESSLRQSSFSSSEITDSESEYESSGGYSSELESDSTSN